MLYRIQFLAKNSLEAFFISPKSGTVGRQTFASTGMEK